MCETNSITYRSVGDYNIPNLVISPEEANIRLGKWGMLHKDYLLKYNKEVFATLLAEGKLWQYLASIDTIAQQMFDTLVKEMKETECVTEQIKEENPLLWVQKMNGIETRITEIINENLIYT